MSELQKREVLLEEYVKRLGECEYTIESKDIKYEKLRGIYEESMGCRRENRGSELESTVKVRKEAMF